MRSKRLAAVGAALAIVAGVVLWLLLRGGDGASRTATRDHDSAGESARRAAGPLGAGAGPTADRDVPPLAHDGTVPDAPIIDEVIVEKKEVCQGEENLVTVKAHTTEARDEAYLHGAIAGTPGMVVPVKSYLTEDGKQPAPRQVTVFSRQNVPTTVDIPPFEVKDCMVDRLAMLTWRLQPNTDAEFEIGVKVRDIAATTPLAPVVYRWKFGDGATAETAEPWVVHSYDERRQDEELFSGFLIQVEIEGASGEKVVGRRSLVLQNMAYGNLVFTGTVTLSTSLTPRFPKVDDDGVVRQQVRLWHHRPDPVTIDRIRTRKNYATDRKPDVSEVSVSSVLADPKIPPLGVTVAVALDTGADPDVFSVDYLLEGISAEGLPVRGIFPVMTPVKVPTKEDHIPVRDPELVAKIKRARELLDQEFVTDEDIWRLEREGAFDDIVVTGAPPPGEQTYADLPPHPPRSGEPSGDTKLTPGETMRALGQPPKP